MRDAEWRAIISGIHRSHEKLGELLGGEVSQEFACGRGEMYSAGKRER